ncbi:hypothetical protein D6789_00495 [Candidatus Woesearchaeota archaeon]|nr:MAG: hypothetical protein D6789_00495 [Candidatus Woesearchaeota archaeon]
MLRRYVNMKTQTIVVVVLIVLVLASAVQAFQLQSLKGKIADGQVTASVSPSVASSPENGKTSALPSSIKDLPQMVGGC